MKKLILFLTLLFVGLGATFEANAQYSPSNNLNYIKLLKTPPIGSVEDSVMVYDSSSSFVKMLPKSSIVSGKESISNKTSTITEYSTTLYPNEKATHDALDLKLNISDLPTNLTLYPTNATSDISGYVKMVTGIHDADYNVTAVDISTPTITTTEQLVASLITDAGVLIGQPGVFNATTFGNIRRLSGSGTATFYFKIFHRDLAGTETLIGTSSVTEVVTSSSYLEFTGALLWNDGDFIDTDRIVIKYYANRVPGSSDPVYQFQFGGASPVRTLLPVPFSVVDAGYELKSNKQNDLTIDGTGTKYPTVDAVNNALPTSYSKIVYVNTTSPTTATIFDLENPPVTNDNLLKNDTANLYIGTDASTWVYLTGTGYVTKTISSSTSNFNTFGTTVDAGNSKTSHITRSGPVTLTGSLNLAVAKISTTPNTSAGSYDILTRNSSTTALEKVSSISFGNWTYSGSLIYPKGLTDRVVVGMNSEGLGVAFSAKAIGASTNTAFFYDRFNNVILSITENGTNVTNINASGYISSGEFRTPLNGGLISAGASSWFKLLTGDYWQSRGRVDYYADYSSSYTSRSLVDKAYIDAKITQTITNGVTDKSPSEDAVFDALALKVSGSGTTNYLPKFTASGTVGNSLIYDNGTGIGINTDNPLSALQVNTSGQGFIRIGGSDGRTIESFSNAGVPSNTTVANLSTTTIYSTNIIDKTSNQLAVNFGANFIALKTANTEKVRLAVSGALLLNTTADDGIATNKLQVNGNVKATQFRISALNTAPASATDTGTLGEVRITATYIYVCTATNTWVRTALATW